MTKLTHNAMKEPRVKFSLELIGTVQPVSVNKMGVKTVLKKSYYDDGCLCDLKENPVTYFVFVRHFKLLVGKTGKAHIEYKREVKEIWGKTKTAAEKALDKFTDELDGCVPAGWEDDYTWLPDGFDETLAAIKSGALKA